MTEEASLWLTLLGLIPFGAGLVAFLVYLQMRRWKAEVLARLDELRADLRGKQNQLTKARQVAQMFSIEDPDPYGGLVGQVIEGVSTCEPALSEDYQRYAELHTHVNALLRQTGLYRLVSAFDWHRLEYEIRILQDDLDVSQDAIAALAEPVHRLQRLGWETASQARTILQSAQTAGEMFQELGQEALIEDPELDSAWQDACEWEETLLAQVPVVYFQDDEESVLAGTDKETTAHVYRVIKEARPAVEALAAKARHWQEEYARLAHLIQEVHRIHARTATLYASLQKSSYLPVEWEKTQALLARNAEQLAGAGAVIQKRSLAQMKADLLAVEGLMGKLAELEKHVQWMGEQQSKLGALLDVLQARQEEHWLEGAIATAEHAGLYDPENFLGKGSIPTLAADLKRLAGLYERVLNFQPQAPVRESALPVLVQTAEQAAVLQEGLRAQSEITRARLDEILSIESQQRDQLLRARALLGQVTALIGSNPFLKRLARSDPEGLSGQIEALLGELDQPARGSVAAKTRRISPLLKRAEATFTQWADALDKEVTERKQELLSKTEVLESKVKLDEPAIADTLRLLRRVELELGSKELKPAEDLLSAQADRLKVLNQAHQGCLINLQRLDEFAGTVLEMFQKAEKHRKAAAQRLDEAQDIAPEALKWPPCSQRLSSEEAQYQTLEQRWLSLQQEPLKAIQMASKLSDLSERYQSLELQLKQLVEAAKQEQGRVLEYDKRLQSSIKLWQRQAAQYSSNRQAQSAIQSLLEEINRDYEALKKRYERGVIQYPQALQGIRQLCRRIDEASVALDEKQDIDINGTVQQRM